MLSSLSQSVCRFALIGFYGIISNYLVKIALILVLFSDNKASLFLHLIKLYYLHFHDGLFSSWPGIRLHFVARVCVLLCACDPWFLRRVLARVGVSVLFGISDQNASPFARY